MTQFAVLFAAGGSTINFSNQRKRNSDKCKKWQTEKYSYVTVPLIYGGEEMFRQFKRHSLEPIADSW